MQAVQEIQVEKDEYDQTRILQYTTTTRDYEACIKHFIFGSVVKSSSYLIDLSGLYEYIL